MSYDRADWHYGGNYPKDLPTLNGGTHIGMFLAWAIISGVEGEEHQEDCPESLAAVRARKMTGREFLFRECDGKFCDADLNCVLASDLPSTYHVEDTWDNYDKIAATITQRFKDWKRKNG
jgi:hypothetical protein